MGEDYLLRPKDRELDQFSLFLESLAPRRRMRTACSLGMIITPNRCGLLKGAIR